MRSGGRRTRLFLAAGLVASSLAITAGTTLAGPAAAAPTAEGCPIDYQAPHNGALSSFTDATANVFVGGDFEVLDGAAEAEGVVVVNGDVHVGDTQSNRYNLGTVGVGSRVGPPAMSDMLLAGGAVTVDNPTTLDVGAGVGGNVVAGGAVTGTIETNGGDVSAEVVDPLAPYSSLGTTVMNLSAQVSAKTPTGTASVSGATLTLDGSGSDTGDQVFRIDAGDLPDALLYADLNLVDVELDRPIYVTVTGAAPAIRIDTVLIEGSTMLPWSDTAAELATHLLWNIPGATTLAITGSGQVPGSFLVARNDSATVIDVPGTNGRIWTRGDLEHSGTSGGREMHGYPFVGLEEMSCDNDLTEPAVGGLSVAKSLDAPAGAIADDTTFSGTWSCSLDGDRVAHGSWRTTAGAAPVELAADVPAGATCAVTEDLPGAPAGFEWLAPVISPTTAVIADGGVAPFTVDNELVAAAPVVGSLAVSKTVIAPDGVVSADVTYGGTWSCAVAGEVVADGVWSLVAGATEVVASDLPEGASCVVDEGDLPAAPAGHTWSAPVIVPGAVSIAGGSQSTVVVTNTLTADEAAEALGSLEVTKILDDPADVVDGERDFSGTWSCTLGDEDVADGTWSTSAAAGATLISADLPEGATCILDEVTPDAAPAAGFVWEAPQITPASVTVADGQTVGFTVTNAVTALAPVLGALTVEKQLVDADGILAEDTEFTGTWTCRLGETTVDGTWATTAGAAPLEVSDEIPAGATCQVTEDAPAELADGHHWAPVVLSPAALTVTADGTSAFVVTNTVAADEVAGGGDGDPSGQGPDVAENDGGGDGDVTADGDSSGLPDTGSPAILLPGILAALFALIAGAVLVIRSRRTA